MYDYSARHYLLGLGWFVSADTVVPGAGNPQALNRFAYSFNNPLKYTDLTGHRPSEDEKKSGNLPEHPEEVQWFAKLLRGTLYHKIIEANHRLKNPKDHGGNNIPNGTGRSEFSIKGGGEEGGYGFPDLVGTDSGIDNARTAASVTIWEVKPDNAAGVAEGRKQMSKYISKCSPTCKPGDYIFTPGKSTAQIQLLDDTIEINLRLDIDPGTGKPSGVILYDVVRDDNRIWQEIKSLSKVIEGLLPLIPLPVPGTPRRAW